MALKLERWNVQDHLKSGKQAAAFWEAALAGCDGDAKWLLTALGEIARSKGMAPLARRAGVPRLALRGALGRERNPSFASVMKVLHALRLAPFAHAERTRGATSSRVRKTTGRPPTPPGQMLVEEYLKPRGLTPADLAKRTGLSARQVSAIISGRRRVTPAVAVLLSRALNTSARLWTGLQVDHDQWKVPRRLKPRPARP